MKKNKKQKTTTNNNHVNNCTLNVYSSFNRIDFDMHILPCYPSNKLTDKNLTFEGKGKGESKKERERDNIRYCH